MSLQFRRHARWANSALRDIFIVAPVYFLAIAGSAAATKGCTADAPPLINVDTSEGGLSYDFNQNIDQIEKNTPQQDVTSHGKRSRARGLTKALMALRFVTKLQSQRMSDGRFCLALTEVTATLGYSHTTVYVDRKYRSGTCEFNAILDHENQHVKLNRETLRRSVPQIRAALKKASSEVNPLVVDSVNSGKKHQMDLIQKQINLYIKALNTSRESANAAIDTIESYRATQAKCRNW